MTLAERLKRTIEARGFSISEVAKLAEMEKMQAHRIVNGSNPNPGVLTVERLAGAMGVTLGELFADPE